MIKFGKLDVGDIFLEFEAGTFRGDSPRAWVKADDDGLTNAFSGQLRTYFEDETDVQIDADLYDIKFNCATGARHYFKKGQEFSLCNVSLNRGFWADARVPFITCTSCARLFQRRHGVWPSMSNRVLKEKDDDTGDEDTPRAGLP